jgi:hypothetical protein
MFSLCFRASLLTAICALAAACSGGGDGDGGADAGATADGGATADAGPQPDGSSPAACVAVSDFGDQGTIDGEVIVNVENAYLSIDSNLEAGPPQDLLVIELFGGYGVLADGLANGTYEITGDETNYNDCGVCVTVYGDFDPMTGSEMVYVAQSGTVTITSVEGNFAGTFVPAAGGSPMVGYAPNASSMMYDQRSDCTITGGGATWDKAIPAAP